jgi:hypothetical protein
VTEQKPEQAGAEEAGGKPAEQAVAEEARTTRAAAEGRRCARLRHAALDRRSRRRGACGRGRREGAHAAAATGKSAAGARIGAVARDEHQSSRNRGERDQPTVADHECNSPRADMADRK